MRKNYLLVCGFLIIILVALYLPTATYQAASLPTIPTYYENFDIRTSYYLNLNTHKEAASQNKAKSSTAGLLRNFPATTQIGWHLDGLRPRMLFSYQEPLTKPNNQDSLAIAETFLVDNYSLYGVPVDSLKVVRNYQTKHNGMQHLAWQQYHQGLPIFGAEARFTMTQKGEIVLVNSELIPTNLLPSTANTQPNILAAQALAVAAANVGINDLLGSQPVSQSDGLDQRTTFAASESLADNAAAKMIFFPTNSQGKDIVRLAWEVRLTDKLGRSYDIIVDAQNAQVLLRHNLTWYFDQSPRYRVFAHNPQPNLPFISLNPPKVDRVAISTNGDPIASPKGWLDPNNPTTVGNNVDAQIQQLTNNSVNIFRPSAPDLNFDFPLVLNTLGQEPETFPSASVTNLFYGCNFMHDYLYKLGFDEASGNFQEDNFGRGGIGSDPVIATTQGAKFVNNASFGTSEDGFPGQMSLLFFTTAKPKIDSAYDAEVYIHEYVHGLTTRLVGDTGSVLTLIGAQSAGMGEGWSDWYSISILSKSTDNPRGSYPFGSYVTQIFDRGIRRFPYAADMAINLETYGDIDPLQSRLGKNVTEVHNVGEIWCEALLEVRANFIEAYGYEQGKQMIEQLVTDALKLTPINPTMVDGRDAILLADQINSNGANQNLIWRGFAKRGIGFNARSLSGSSDSVKQSFDLPPFCQRTGTILLDKQVYFDGDSLQISLGDADLVGQSQATVMVTTSSGDVENLTLSANSRIPGQFLATTKVSMTSVQAGNGLIEAKVGDTISLSYQDAANEQGQAAQTKVTVLAAKPQVIVNEPVESNMLKFKLASAWQVTTAFAHSPSHSFANVPSKAKRNNSALTSRKLDLSKFTGAQLIFWQKYDIGREFNLGFIDVKVGTAPWQAIASFGGSQTDFQLTRVDLSQYDGQKIKVRFRLTDINGTSLDTWYIDDIQVVSGTTN